MGRQGTGPGEFQMPRGMTVLENGSVIVSDMGGGALSVFDDSLRWVENITGFFTILAEWARQEERDSSETNTSGGANA